MLEIFVVGSMGFWALIAAEIILLFVFTEYNNGVGATVSLLVFGAALQFVSKIDLLAYMYHHPLVIVAVFVGYILLGIFWGIFKWRQFYLAHGKAYDELFSKFLADNKLPATTDILPVEYRSHWKRKLENSSIYDGETGNYIHFDEVPQAGKHKVKIMRWMYLWIFSFILYCFKDLVIEFWMWIYTGLATFLQKMADKDFAKRKINENLDIPDEK